VGHIFYFGTKYSEPLGLSILDQKGQRIFPHMGSYGIGVSRLVASLIEANHDDKGIIWPESVAPFLIGLINLQVNDKGCLQRSDQIYGKFNDLGISILYDDRDERPGVKFAAMDLIGLPWQVIVGPKNLKSNTVELKNRRTNAIETHSLERIIDILREDK